VRFDGDEEQDFVGTGHGQGYAGGDAVARDVRFCGVDGGEVGRVGGDEGRDGVGEGVEIFRAWRGWMRHCWMSDVEFVRLMCEEKYDVWRREECWKEKWGVRVLKRDERS
jgi:hypothetical protein